MKNLKHAAAGCGVVGLASVFLPWFKAPEQMAPGFETLGLSNPFSLWNLGQIADKLGESPTGMYMLMVGFVVGAGAMIYAITQGGATKKIAGIAAGAFGIALWKSIQLRGDAPEGIDPQIGANLSMLCSLAGLGICAYVAKNPDVSDEGSA